MSVKHDSIIINILTLSMLISASIHIWIVPLHLPHAIAHGLLFLILGTLQIIWSFIFLRRPSVNLAQWGIYLAGSSIALWIITRFLPAPFGHGAEPITIIGVVTKIVEALAILFLFIWLRKEASLKKRIKVIIISAVIGSFLYGAGKISEPYLPGLGSPDLHRGHDVHKDEKI